MKAQITIQIQTTSTESEIFETPVLDQRYKNCITCGQELQPFKHGKCPLCKADNWIIQFEKPQIPKIEKLGIVELTDN